MNRRGFISLLVGSAGAPFVPWRGLVEPLIVLPTVPEALVLVSGLEILQFRIDRSWLRGRYYVNTDAAMMPRARYERLLRRFNADLVRQGLAAELPEEFYRRRLRAREVLLVPEQNDPLWPMDV